MSRRAAHRPTRLGVELLEGRDLPAPIAIGSVVSAAISARGETDVLSFSATAGQIFQVAGSGQGQAGFSLAVDIHAPGRGTPDFTLTSGGNRQFTIPADGTGTWSLRVRDDDRMQTGTYSVGLERITPRSPDAQTLTLGGRVGGTIAAPIEKDQFTFDTKAGEIYQIVHTSTPKQSGFKAQLLVYRPDGFLHFFRPLEPNENRQFEVPAGQGGRWVVQMEDDDRVQTGTYTIGLERIAPASPDARPLALGGRVSGSISTPIKKDQWTFDTKAGEIYQIVHTSTPNAGQPGFKAHLRLYDPDGNLHFFRPLDPNENRQFTVPVGQGGRWVVQIEDDDRTQTGRYTIGLERISPNSPDAQTLVRGRQATGSIAAPIEKDQFTFDVQAGQRFRIGHTSTPGSGQTGFKAQLLVYRPDGTLHLFRPLEPNENREFTIPTGATGRWVAQLEDDDRTQTGTYTIQLDKLS